MTLVYVTPHYEQPKDTSYFGSLQQQDNQKSQECTEPKKLKREKDTTIVIYH
jgi:hypothetical protein